eukprot:12033460-Heterocapsa_arctica.AAC.1
MALHSLSGVHLSVLRSSAHQVDVPVVARASHSNSGRDPRAFGQEARGLLDQAWTQLIDLPHAVGTHVPDDALDPWQCGQPDHLGEHP